MKLVRTTTTTYTQSSVASWDRLLCNKTLHVYSIKEKV